MIANLKIHFPNGQKSPTDLRSHKHDLEVTFCDSKTIERQLIEVVHTFVIFLCVRINFLFKKKKTEFLSGNYYLF